MTRALFVEASPRGAESASRRIAEALVERLIAQEPDMEILRRDLTLAPPPPLDGATIAAIYPAPGAEANPAALALSDRLTDEFLACDLLVIATPIWNFGLPAALKAWIDQIIRPGRTFSYSAQGPTGLARDKKAILILASGGLFSVGPWREWDFAEPYLRKILGFVGVADVRTVRVEGLNLPGRAAQAFSDAREAIGALEL